VIERLPPLSIGDCSCRLPLAEPTAAALLQVLIEPTDQHAHQQLAEALALDPALALWTVCQPSRLREGSSQATTINELASWLAANLASLVAHWPAENGQPRRAKSGEPLVAAKLASLAAADVIAAEQAAARGRVYSGHSYLVALLHGAPKWLRAIGCTADCVAALPEWLKQQPDPNARAKSKAPSRKKPSAKTTAAHAAKIGSRAEAARQRWLVSPGFAAQNFAHTASKFARLVELETQFDRRLEEEKLESLAEFAAGAGHEINNPLAVISGRAQLFLRHEQDPERRRELAVINTQARRVHEMIADLMLFARPPQPRLEPCNVAQTIETVVAELATRAEAQSVTLAFDCPRDLPALHADVTQLQVALRAMCENAFDALSPGGRIEIVCSVQQFQETIAARHGSEPSPLVGEGRVRGKPARDRRGAEEHPASCNMPPSRHIAISVRDNGPGIPSDVRRHAFDPFYSGRGAGRGLGNGLSKCWRIVTAHGGRVEIDSTSQGTCVMMLLPVSNLSTNDEQALI
jgi:hypothetical protein